MATKDISDVQVLLACKQFHGQPYNGDFALEILAKATGQPEKVCFRAMERAEERGFIEYGTSLRGAWVTDVGDKLLKDSSSTCSVSL